MKPPKIGRDLYLLPWTYRGWAHQIPIFHCGRFHISVWKMGRSCATNFWLPNVSLHWSFKRSEY